MIFSLFLILALASRTILFLILRYTPRHTFLLPIYYSFYSTQTAGTAFTVFLLFFYIYCFFCFLRLPLSLTTAAMHYTSLPFIPLLMSMIKIPQHRLSFTPITGGRFLLFFFFFSVCLSTVDGFLTKLGGMGVLEGLQYLKDSQDLGTFIRLMVRYDAVWFLLLPGNLFVSCQRSLLLSPCGYRFAFCLISAISGHTEDVDFWVFFSLIVIALCSLYLSSFYRLLIFLSLIFFPFHTLTRFHTL